MTGAAASCGWYTTGTGLFRQHLQPQVRNGVPTLVPVPAKTAPNSLQNSRNMCSDPPFRGERERPPTERNRTTLLLGGEFERGRSGAASPGDVQTPRKERHDWHRADIKLRPLFRCYWG
jgi:hypothetical protein